MFRILEAPVLVLALGAVFLSVEIAVIGVPAPSTGLQGPVRTFDPLSLPKDTTARAPFLDPTALFSDQVYVVRPMAEVAEGSVHNASFGGGEQALVSYLKTRVLQHIAPGIGWLKPPVLYFQVDATGAPTQVELVKTTGNAELDGALVRIFREMPSWQAATDAKGRAVTQAFEFVVGPGGC